MFPVGPRNHQDSHIYYASCIMHSERVAEYPGYQTLSKRKLRVDSQFSFRESLVPRVVAEWLRRLTRKPKVRTAVGSNPTLDSLVAVRNTSPGLPEPWEGNLVAVAGSCGGLMVKHPWPLLEISLSDFRGLATLNINTYLPIYFEINQLETILS